MAGVLRAPASLWRTYTKHLDKRPLQTKIVTSVAAAVLGDCLAQRTSRPHKSELNSDDWQYDWARTARLCAFNGVMGCFGHFYYGAVDARVMPQAAKSVRAVLSKVAIDQLIFAPICTVFFYLYKCASEGRPAAIREELQAKYLPTLVAGWKLWPAAHVINFAFVPTHQRILYVNLVSVAGNFVLSKAANAEYPKEEAEVVPSATRTLKDPRREVRYIHHPDGHTEVLLDMNVKID